MPFAKKSYDAPPTEADSLPEAEKLRELIACEQSCAYFLDTYGHILDPLQGDISFHLWPVHLEILDIILNNPRTIILKSRQVGVSWLTAGYALWRANFKDGANVLMLSKREDEAKALLNKSYYIYQSLPLFLRRKLLKKNESEFLFADPNKPGVSISSIKAFPSTPDAGRSEAASDVIADEWAYHPYAEENYGAYKPTIDAGGRLIGISTANGVGNFFHRVYMGAKTPTTTWTRLQPTGLNGFVPLFIPWYARPGRDNQWYDKQVQEFSETPHLLAQEYPSNDIDAFITSGNCYFNTAAIHNNMQYTMGPKFADLGGCIKKWRLPQYGEFYVIGADCAEGRGLDLSGAAVYHYRTFEHVADLHGDFTPDQFAHLLWELAKEYNNAFICIEKNSVGVGVLLDLTKKFGYKEIYKHRRLEASLKLTSKQLPTNEEYGWPTSPVTRPILLKDLSSSISTYSITSYDKAFWEECLTFVNNNGKLQAAEGCKDDRVIKHALALQAHKAFIPPSKAEKNSRFVTRGSV